MNHNTENLKQRLRGLIAQIRAAADNYPSDEFDRIADEIAALDAEIKARGLDSAVRYPEPRNPGENTFREIRKARNLTQTEAGKRIGVSKQMISQYELGERDPFAFGRRFAAAFGVVFEVHGDRVTWRDNSGPGEAIERLYEPLAHDLATALRDLYDAQNGPPLELDRAEWEAAMKRAGEVLILVGY